MLTSERKNIVDIVYDKVDKFILINWCEMFVQHLIVVMISYLLISYLDFFNKFTKILVILTVPLLLIVLSHIIFRFFLHWHFDKVLSTLSKEEKKIFLKRNKPLRNYSKNFLWTNLIVYAIIIFLTTKIIEFETNNNGKILKYGVITNLTKVNTRHSTKYYVHFSYIRNGKKDNGFSEVKYYDNEYRNEYFYPIKKEDEFAILYSEKFDSGSKMYFKTPSPHQIELTKKHLIKEYNISQIAIDEIYKNFDYIGLMALYHTKNPHYWKKINAKTRDELEKILENKLFQWYSKNGLQQAVTFTGADDADADFLLPLTNFLTADNAAGG